MDGCSGPSLSRADGVQVTSGFIYFFYVEFFETPYLRAFYSNHHFIFFEFNTTPSLNQSNTLLVRLTMMFVLFQRADEPTGDGGEKQSVHRGSDRLGSQHLVAGNHQEHPGVDAAGKEPNRCSRLSPQSLCGSM